MINFSDLKTLECYCYYEGELAFTVEFDGVTYLSYFWGQKGYKTTVMRFQTSSSDLELLKADKITILDFMKRSPKIYKTVWCASLKEQLECTLVAFEDIADGAPDEAVYLEMDRE